MMENPVRLTEALPEVVLTAVPTELSNHCGDPAELLAVQYF